MQKYFLIVFIWRNRERIVSNALRLHRDSVCAEWSKWSTRTGRAFSNIEIANRSNEINGWEQVETVEGKRGY